MAEAPTSNKPRDYVLMDDYSVSDWLYCLRTHNPELYKHYEGYEKTPHEMKQAVLQSDRLQRVIKEVRGLSSLVTWSVLMITYFHYIILIKRFLTRVDEPRRMSKTKWQKFWKKWVTSFSCLHSARSLIWSAKDSAA